MIETQPVLPSQSGLAPLRPRRAAVMVPLWDHGLLEQRQGLYQLASDLARNVVIPKIARQVTVVLKDPAVELRALVRSGRVGTARALIDEVYGRSRPHWAKVLDTPQATLRPKSGRSDFGRNADWIRRHRATFVGKWVALIEGQLVDHDESRVALHRRLEATQRLVRGMLFAKVD